MKVLTIEEFNEQYPESTIDPEGTYDSNKEMISTIVESVEKSGNELVQIYEGMAEPVLILK